MPGMKFIADDNPQFGASTRQLAAQLVCHYGPENVNVNTGFKTFFSVPKAACDALGAPPFTSNGQAITCPTDEDDWVPYYIKESDVAPLTYPGCEAIAPLPAPAGLAATPGDGQVALTWDAVENASGYQVQYRTGTGAWATVNATGTNATVTGLTNGTAYEFQVKALGDGSNHSDSPFSASVNATPAPPAPLPVPEGLAGTPGDTEVALTWSAVTGATGYTVRYRTGSGTWATMAATGTSTTVTGLTNDTAYEFQVQANGDGSRPDSDWSASVNATPVAP